MLKPLNPGTSVSDAVAYSSSPGTPNPPILVTKGHAAHPKSLRVVTRVRRKARRGQMLRFRVWGFCNTTRTNTNDTYMTKDTDGTNSSNNTIAGSNQKTRTFLLRTSAKLTTFYRILWKRGLG